MELIGGLGVKKFCSSLCCRFLERTVETKTEDEFSSVGSREAILVRFYGERLEEVG